MLKAEAKYWWDATKHWLITLGGGNVISWNAFVKALIITIFLQCTKNRRRKNILC